MNNLIEYSDNTDKNSCSAVINKNYIYKNILSIIVNSWKSDYEIMLYQVSVLIINKKNPMIYYRGDNKEIAYKLFNEIKESMREKEENI